MERVTVKSADRVVVSWIDPGLVEGDFATSLIELFRARPSRVEGIVRIQGSLLSRQRNEVVKTFLDHQSAAWLLMVDSDEAFTPEDFDLLVGAAHATERPVVAGLYFGTIPNPSGLLPSPVPHIYRQADDGISVIPVTDYPVNKVIEIDAAGTGALLIHRSVLEAIRTHADPSEGDAWCWFRDLPVNGMWLGEDLYFCRRIKSLGFPIHAHTGALFRHRRRYWLDDRQHQMVRALQKEETLADEKQISEAATKRAAAEPEQRAPEGKSDERGFVKRDD